MSLLSARQSLAIVAGIAFIRFCIVVPVRCSCIVNRSSMEQLPVVDSTLEISKASFDSIAPRHYSFLKIYFVHRFVPPLCLIAALVLIPSPRSLHLMPFCVTVVGIEESTKRQNRNGSDTMLERTWLSIGRHPLREEANAWRLFRRSRFLHHGRNRGIGLPTSFGILRMRIEKQFESCCQRPFCFFVSRRSVPG